MTPCVATNSSSHARRHHGISIQNCQTIISVIQEIREFYTGDTTILYGATREDQNDDTRYGDIVDI